MEGADYLKLPELVINEVDVKLSEKEDVYKRQVTEILIVQMMKLMQIAILSMPIAIPLHKL